MKKVRFLFYISGEYDKFLSKAIAWWSGLWNKQTIPTSHEELEFCSRTPAEIESLVKTTHTEGRLPLYLLLYQVGRYNHYLFHERRIKVFE